MKLEESFEVDAPVDEVWRALIDVQRVAPCLPGAEITETGEDATYQGNFQVKLGPTTAAYSGTLKLESIDEAARVATMNATGRDKRGQGSAKATMVSTVTEAGAGGARVHVDTDFTITGRLARFGRGGMIQDISKRLLGDFARCLQEELRGSGVTAASQSATADPSPPAPVDGSSEERSGAAGQVAEPAAAGGAEPADRSPSGPQPAAPATADPSAQSGAPATPARARSGANATPARGAPPVSAFSLILSVLRDRIRRFLDRRRKTGGDGSQ